MPLSPAQPGKFSRPSIQETRTNTHKTSGIGLETSILFAQEGANVMMADISVPALEKAQAKVLQLVPGAKRVETMVRTTPPCSSPPLKPLT